MKVTIAQLCFVLILAVCSSSATGQISTKDFGSMGVSGGTLPPIPASLGLLEEVNRLDRYNTSILEHNALALQYLEARRGVNGTYLWGLGAMGAGAALGATDPSQADENQEAGWKLYAGSAFVVGGFIAVLAAPTKRRNTLQAQMDRALSTAQSLYTVQPE